MQKRITIRNVGRAWRRLQRHGILSHLLGLAIRGRFQRAGLVTIVGGWSLPGIRNLGGRIEIGNCAFFPGVRLEVWQGAEIVIGDGTYLNRNTEIVAARSVRIGRDCMIARDVLIMDTDQHALPGQELQIAPVVLEDRVWVGARAIILKGVQVGHDSIVGAGAIVTRSVAPHTVVAGPPARPIRQLAPDGTTVTTSALAEGRGADVPAAARPGDPEAKHHAAG
jgi:acetyltransferase-like isoleucine patch superfamily enzyme